MVSAQWASRVLASGSGDLFGGHVQRSFRNQGDSFTKDIVVVEGQKILIALAWDSKTAGSDIYAKTDVLAADLDLFIRLPNNAGLKMSASAQNAYESIRFTSPVSGTATIKVNAYRMDTNLQGWALAWTKRL